MVRPNSPPKVPLPVDRWSIPKPHYLPHTWTRPTYDASGSDPPFVHSALDRPTHRQIVHGGSLMIIRYASTRPTPPNNTTLGNRLYAQCKRPNVTNPICLLQCRAEVLALSKPFGLTSVRSRGAGHHWICLWCRWEVADKHALAYSTHSYTAIVLGLAYSCVSKCNVGLLHAPRWHTVWFSFWFIFSF